MNFPEAIKALTSLAENNNVLVSKAKARKVLTRALKDEDMSIDDAYLALSNAFLADRNLFADHEQLSASGSVVNEAVARLDRDERDAELRARLGKDRAGAVDDARAEWDAAHPGGSMSTPNQARRFGRNDS